MNTQELEAKLDGSKEIPTLDFKQAVDWSIQTFVKDLLAMANTDGGGEIIVGVVDKTWDRQGVNDVQAATYDIDIMKDQVAPYADPAISFDVDFPEDSTGKKYVVITVHPFKEQPIICAKQGNDVKPGQIYYRSEDGRPNSKAIATAMDMRELLDRATVLRMHRFESIGLTVPNTDEALFAKERGEL